MLQIQEELGKLESQQNMIRAKLPRSTSKGSDLEKLKHLKSQKNDALKRLEKIEMSLRDIIKNPSLHVLNNAVAHALLGEVQRREGKLEDAKENLEKAVELGKGISFADASSKNDAFAKASLVEVSISLVKRQIQQGNLEGKALLEKIIEGDEKNAPALASLGEIMRQQGNFEKAKEYLNRAIEIDSNDNSILNLVDVLKQLGELDDARRYLNRILNYDQTNDIALASLGDVLTQLKEYNEAGRELNKAIRFKDNALAHAYFGELRLQEGSLDDANYYLQKALLIDPKNAVAYASLGKVRIKEGNLEEAREYLQKALEFDPKNASAQASLKSLLI
jgi:tetratricopeptide (TPR) repeat protein